MWKLLIWWWQLSERNIHIKLENPTLGWHIKLAQSQKDYLFQKRWCCVARTIFLFPKPGSNTRSIKVKTFSMAFQYGLCYTGSRLLLCVFYPGAGWNFLLLYPEGFLQRGDAVSGFWCAGHSFEGFCLVLLERAKQDFHFAPFTKILTVFSVWRYNLCFRQKIVLLTRELINLFWYCL